MRGSRASIATTLHITARMRYPAESSFVTCTVLLTAALRLPTATPLRSRNVPE